jgi:hypothetical protein
MFELDLTFTIKVNNLQQRLTGVYMDSEWLEDKYISAELVNNLCDTIKKRLDEGKWTTREILDDILMRLSYAITDASSIDFLTSRFKEVTIEYYGDNKEESLTWRIYGPEPDNLMHGAMQRFSDTYPGKKIKAIKIL